MLRSVASVIYAVPLCCCALTTTRFEPTQPSNHRVQTNNTTLLYPFRPFKDIHVFSYRFNDLFVTEFVPMLTDLFQGLFQAGEKTLGTDESTFNSILCSQSFEQLRLVFQEYRKIASKGLDQAIKNEMSGNLEKGMVTLGMCAIAVDHNCLDCVKGFF